MSVYCGDIPSFIQNPIIENMRGIYAYWDDRVRLRTRTNIKSYTIAQKICARRDRTFAQECSFKSFEKDVICDHNFITD